MPTRQVDNSGCWFCGSEEELTRRLIADPDGVSTSGLFCDRCFEVMERREFDWDRTREELTALGIEVRRVVEVEINSGDETDEEWAAMEARKDEAVQLLTDKER